MIWELTEPWENGHTMGCHAERKMAQPQNRSEAQVGLRKIEESSRMTLLEAYGWRRASLYTREGGLFDLTAS